MTKFAESSREIRLRQRYNATINEDGGTDCRENIVPVTERTRVLKPVSRKTDGQYTKMSSHDPKFRLVIYPYDQSHIYRRDLKTGFEVAIVEKVDGEWFPCVILRETEIQQLRSFPGAAGMDIDKAIATKDRCKIKYTPASKNVGSRCIPKGTSKKGSKPRTNNKFKKMMDSIEVHNAHKKGK